MPRPRLLTPAQEHAAFERYKAANHNRTIHELAAEHRLTYNGMKAILRRVERELMASEVSRETSVPGGAA